MKNEECNKAIKRIFKKIDMNKINEFINEIPCISSIRKDFYINILRLRYDMIKKSYNSIL